MSKERIRSIVVTISVETNYGTRTRTLTQREDEDYSDFETRVTKTLDEMTDTE